MAQSTRAVRWAVEAAAAVLVVLLLFSGRHGLERWFLGGGAGERGVYMKLPLEQPEFHWFFVDEQALLSGSLEIEMHGAGGRDTVLTVFGDGRMAPGWEPVSRDSRGVYFGFTGGGPVWTEPDDSLVIRLRVAEDLDGVGAYLTGVLRKGEYEAVASYSLLTGHPGIDLFQASDEPTAFMGCWRPKWKLDVTSERGWKGSAADERDPGGDGWRGRVEERAFAPRGTDGFRCVE